MISKKIIASAIAVFGLSLLTFLGINQVQAETNNPVSGLVQMLSQKFGLDQTKVQEVFDEYHYQQKEAMGQKMKERQADRLEKFVQEGKITSAQKQEIIDKQAEILQQRKEFFQKQRDEIKSWAQSRGIDPEIILPIFGKRGMPMKFGHWFKDSSPSAAF